jgi:hypothetical protein
MRRAEWSKGVFEGEPVDHKMALNFRRCSLLTLLTLLSLLAYFLLTGLPSPSPSSRK